jgi:glycosyltransferase involved in cell wall biosynthesis
VLHHLACAWPEGVIDARFGFISGGRYVTGPVDALGVAIGATFQAGSSSSTTSEAMQGILRSECDQIVAISDIDKSFRAYLLPEPSFRRDNLAVAEGLQNAPRTTSFFIYYDALPLTDPQFFPRGADKIGALPRYHQAVAASENVAFISERTREVFESRVARRVPTNAIVSRPGANGLVPVTGVGAHTERPTFTVLATIEPRKGQRVVLEAFERLWAAGRDYRLVFIGAPGPEQPEFLARIRKQTSTTRLEWIEEAGDDAVASALARSSAMVFLPLAEGYGLPPLEALASGCPVIVPADLPALEGLSDAGQVRLSAVTAESVVSAVETLAGAEANAAYRRAISNLKLPTWKQFADEVESWIEAGLECPSRGRASSDPEPANCEA